jgi:hypothetical protein
MIIFEPVRIEREFLCTSCLDDCIATACRYYGIEYRFAYSETWDFIYTPQAENPSAKFSERIRTDNVTNRYGCLEKYHAIKLNYHYSSNTEELLGIVEKELHAGRVLCIRMDSFYLPWDPIFNFGHTNHVCMPVNVEREKGLITVADPFNMMTGLEFPIDKLNEASGFCIAFEIDPGKNESFDSRHILMDMVGDLLKKRRGRNSFDNMKTFAEDFLTYFDPNIEMDDSKGNFSRGPLYHHMINLAFGRSLFLISLKYVAEKHQSEELKQLALRFRRMISKWNIIIALMQRTFRDRNEAYETWKIYRENLSFSTDYQKIKENVHKILQEEAVYEEETAEKIQAILEALEKPHGHALQRLAQESRDFAAESQYRCLELDNFFNNKAFGRFDVPGKANFTGYGEYLLLDDKLEDHLSKVGDMVFKTAGLWKSENDNISCKEQIIEFEPFLCNGICFLASAEWGSYFEPVRLWNSRGELSEVNLGVSDFAFEIKYDEKIAWSGKSALIQENGTVLSKPEAKIYYVACNLDECQELVQIQLPMCTNIHIFAITLRQS